MTVGAYIVFLLFGASCIQLGASFFVQENQIFVKNGDKYEAEFHCSYNESGTLILASWYKNDQKLLDYSPAHNLPTLEDSRLSFTPPADGSEGTRITKLKLTGVKCGDDHGDTYRCIIKLLGKDDGQKTMTLDVQVAPRPPKIEIDWVSGSNVQYTCSVGGATPPAMVRMFRNDVEVVQDQVETITDYAEDATGCNVSTTTVKMNAVSVTDMTTEKIMCKAAHATLQDELYSLKELKSEFYVRNLDDELKASPGAEKDEYLLDCTVSSYPASKYKWYRLTSDNQQILVGGDELLKVEKDESDYTYMCEISYPLSGVVANKTWTKGGDVVKTGPLEEDDDTGAIVGGVIGALVGLAILIGIGILVYVLFWRKYSPPNPDAEAKGTLPPEGIDSSAFQGSNVEITMEEKRKSVNAEDYLTPDPYPAHPEIDGPSPMGRL